MEKVIIYSEDFIEKLEIVLLFIAEDSNNKAKEFYKSLIEVLEGLTFMPFKYRKSKFFGEKTVRDCVFKGYVIPYRIEEDKIIIIDMIKYRNFNDKNK